MVPGNEARSLSMESRGAGSEPVAALSEGRLRICFRGLLSGVLNEGKVYEPPPVRKLGDPTLRPPRFGLEGRAESLSDDVNREDLESRDSARGCQIERLLPTVTNEHTR